MASNRLRICIAAFPVDTSFAVPLSNLEEILCALSETVYVIAGYRNSGDAEQAVTSRNPGVQTYRIFQKRGKNVFARIAKYVYLQVRISFAIARLYRNIDVCIFFMPGGVLLPMLSARLAGKKVLWALPSSLEEMGKHDKDRLSSMSTFLQGVSYRLPNLIILYTESLIREWHLERHRHKIAIARRQFLDFRRFVAQKPLAERANLIGCIGRLSHEKGILEFMDAIPKVLATREDAVFLIGGDGALRPQFEKCERESNGRVRLVGWIPHDELPHYLNQLRLLVIPSYTEAGPNIAFEAMACGTPVLATPVGTIRDVLVDGETGFLMENNSPQCIAENIIRALTHPGLGRITHNARALVEREFTFEEAVERYRRILLGVSR